MTERSDNEDIQPEEIESGGESMQLQDGDPPRRVPEEESTGNPALDARLAQGVVDFNSGIDTAQVWISAFLVVVLGSVASLALFQVPYHGPARELLLDRIDFHRIATAAEHFDTKAEAPLALLSYGATWQAANGSVLGFHIVDLVLHLLAAVMVYLVARRLLGRAVSEPVAMTAGMLLAVHPLAAASLGLIVGRAAIIATAFMLLGLWIFLRGSALERAARPGSLVLALACFALAYASHAPALAFPLLLLAADTAHGTARRNVLAHLVTFAMAALLVAVRFGAGVGAGDSFPEGVVPVLQAQSQFAAHALAYLAAPLGRFPVSALVSGGWNVLGAAAIAMSAYAGVVFAHKRSALGLPFVWFAAVSLAAPCLLPQDSAYSPQNAYLFLPVPALLLAWLVARFPTPTPRAVAGLVAAAVILVCAWFNYRELVRYTTPVDFWRNAATESSAADTQRYLGEELAAAAQFAETPDQATAVLEQAAFAYRESLALAPEDLDVKETLGRLLLTLGKDDEAIPLLEALLRRRPDNGSITLLLAMHHARQLNEATDKAVIDNAIDWLRRAERFGTLPPELQARYGALLAARGNFADSLVRLRQVHGEDHPMVKELQARTDQIRAIEQQSVELLQQGKIAEGLLRRAEMFASQNRLNPALYLTARVLRDFPDNAEAWALLGYIEGALGNAIAFVDKHTAIAPADASAWRELARRTAAGGYWDAAEIYIGQGAVGWAEGSSPALEMARIALNLQLPAKAAEFMEEAAAVQPESAQVQLTWAEVDLARRDLESARSHLDKALELGAPADAVDALRTKIDEGAAAEAPVRSRIE